MADLDENAQDSLLDAALHSTKDDDAVLGDISADPTVDDSLEDPVILDSLLLTFVYDTCFKPNLVYLACFVWNEISVERDKLTPFSVVRRPISA